VICFATCQLLDFSRQKNGDIDRFVGVFVQNSWRVLKSERNSKYLFLHFGHSNIIQSQGPCACLTFLQHSLKSFESQKFKIFWVFKVWITRLQCQNDPLSKDLTRNSNETNQIWRSNKWCPFWVASILKSVHFVKIT
jgi:hypothetical protein